MIDLSARNLQVCVCFRFLGAAHQQACRTYTWGSVVHVSTCQATCRVLCTMECMARCRVPNLPLAIAYLDGVCCDLPPLPRLPEGPLVQGGEQLLKHIQAVAWEGTVAVAACQVGCQEAEERTGDGVGAGGRLVCALEDDEVGEQA